MSNFLWQDDNKRETSLLNYGIIQTALIPHSNYNLASYLVMLSCLTMSSYSKALIICDCERLISPIIHKPIAILLLTTTNNNKNYQCQHRWHNELLHMWICLGHVTLWNKDHANNKGFMVFTAVLSEKSITFHVKEFQTVLSHTDEVFL